MVENDPREIKYSTIRRAICSGIGDCGCGIAMVPCRYKEAAAAAAKQLDEEKDNITIRWNERPLPKIARSERRDDAKVRRL